MKSWCEEPHPEPYEEPLVIPEELPEKTPCETPERVLPDEIGVPA